MELEKLRLDSRLLPKVWKIYEAAFPEDEKRSEGTQAKVMRLPNYSIYAISKDEEAIALLAVWEFENFVFIEHIAVKEHMRNSGFGTKILRGFLEPATKLVLCAIDLPKTAIAKRRLGFFTRCGFRLNEFDYIQPAYSTEKKPVQMKIMSCPGLLTPKDFEKAREEIHLKVYGCETPVTEI
ncbi:MAG TPA: GNAT family N-acetyltransferase [archaeon]|nr:GNAT family N-acetyltransferase [archaeon]